MAETIQNSVRYLCIFIISLIQKYNISRFVIAYMCMCIFLMNATACIDDILIDTVRIQNTVITEIRLYPAEGPMLRASETPFALDIVRCSKSRTTVDAGRCSQCSPTNGSPGRRRLDVLGRGRIQQRSLGRRWTRSRGSRSKT